MSIPIIVILSVGLLFYLIMVGLILGVVVSKRMRGYACISIIVDILFVCGSFLLLVAFGSYVVFDMPR